MVFVTASVFLPVTATMSSTERPAFASRVSVFFASLSSLIRFLSPQCVLITLEIERRRDTHQHVTSTASHLHRTGMGG